MRMRGSSFGVDSAQAECPSESNNGSLLAVRLWKLERSVISQISERSGAYGRLEASGPRWVRQSGLDRKGFILQGVQDEVHVYGVWSNEREYGTHQTLGK
ncbi:hypothetical protein GX51_06916 [Blastomyces parvus]|uniref:Uncharacterized protein n=1 Tax=Blastomyces parvus TaxID=2060905 RepID=A0A2B7WNY0_9EURO|nr:hypothetical protein GX51_06916 [Blastomyces parvus]